jgi:hypothetical protein
MVVLVLLWWGLSGCLGGDAPVRCIICSTGCILTVVLPNSLCFLRLPALSSVFSLSLTVAS